MGISGKSVRNGVLLAACCLAACSSVPTQPPVETYSNPYSPRYNHWYRHGAVPTRETLVRMRSWESSQRSSWLPAAGGSPNTLAYGGGIDGIGVTSGVPRVYLVFFGSQWASGAGGDPNGVSMFLQALFTGIGTAGEQWSGTMTQYCDGPTVRKGATSCNPATTPHVGYPGQGALAGVWFDVSAPAPANATTAQLGQEAIAAAGHFGNTTPESNRYAQYFVVSPAGTHPDGFNTPSANFCGWHNYQQSAYGDIAYSNMPYVTDAGSSCGQNFVNPGPQGLLDGVSIVSGHEYAETLTDQNPPGGWTNPFTGEEAADECAFISSGQGAAANVPMGTGAFAMQSIWSNDTNECEISHPIL
jgi:serine protease